MTNLSVTKSVLAKLLAEENLTVVHAKIPTASIDLDKRIIHCPIWETMDGQLYDLLMGHEVSHALHTPKQGWHDNIDEKGKKYKSVLNVVEDARIEKLIKRKYPGLGKSFANGYGQLHDRDFFGIKNLKSNEKLNLADRINLFCKIGAHYVVPFTEEERNILREVQNAETWEDVVRVSDCIFGLMQKETENTINTIHDLKVQIEIDAGPSEELDESEGESEIDVEDLEDSDDSNSSEQISADSYSDDDSDLEYDDVESEDSEPMSKHAEEKSEESDAEVGSITDAVFRQRESELIVNNVNFHNFDMPEPVLENIIFPVENMLKLCNNWSLDHKFKFPTSPSASSILTSAHALFNRNNDKAINTLVQEFEMRKNAANYQRQKISKTGELDMRRLHQYKLTNDLFRRVVITPKGKSHGMVLFLDMSGSMGQIFGSTIEQLLVLSTFCRKVNIPFDVYGFSNGVSDKLTSQWESSKYGKRFIYDNKSMLIQESGFHLKHLLSSSFNSIAYKKMFQWLCLIAYNCGKYGNKKFNTDTDFSSYGFYLNATPSCQTLIASREIINRFREKHNVDVVNSIHLTDGEGDTAFSFKTASLYDGSNRMVLHDRKTKKTVTLVGSNYSTQSTQTKLTEWVRETTGCKHIGYYLMQKYQVKRIVNFVCADSKSGIVNATMKNEIVKNYRENEYFAISNGGFDLYFYIKAENENINDGELTFTENMSRNKMAKEFGKFQKNKRKNRRLTSQFASEIAV